MTPRSSRDRIEIDGETVRVWTTVPPADGQANEAVRKLLAKKLGLAPSRLILVRGENSREKIYEIEGLTREEAFKRLFEA